MKKVGLLFFVMALFIGVSSLTVFADIAPKASLSITVENYNGKSCYLDLLSNDGLVDYVDFNNQYSESYKQMPIYKYNVDGWLATHLRNRSLWGNIKPAMTTRIPASLRSTFSYFGIPKVFKVIIQLESGELYVSTGEYNVTEYNQSTIIDFIKDMAKVTTVNGCKISGYVMPEVFSAKMPSPELYQGFTVEAAGTGLKGVTDSTGYFEIAGISKKTSGYKLYISKPGYLKRTVDVTAVQNDLVLNSKGTPIFIWPGDISINNIQDGAINLADIMCVALAFNSVLGDERYIKDCDLDADKCVNMVDIMHIAQHFNKTEKDYPACILPKTAPAETSTPVPTPKLTTFVGRLVWNNIEGGFYGVIGEDEDGKAVKYDIGNGLPGIEECLNTMMSIVEITGYPQPGMSSVHQWGTVFRLVSYKSLDPNELNQIVTPTPAPKLTTFVGRLVWNDIEGGFYGVIGEDEAGKAVKYDIGSGLPGIEECLNTTMSIVEITGYPQTGMYSTHMWGTVFKLVSYKSIDPSKLNITVTPTPAPKLTTFVGRLVWNDIEGGFYGVIGEDEAGKAVKYDIGSGLPGIEECLNTTMSIVEITGYPQPGMYTTHMWGTAFQLVSYKSIDPSKFN